MHLQSHRRFRGALLFAAMLSLAAALAPRLALAQAKFERGPLSLTLEGYANLTTAAVRDLEPGDRGDDPTRIDSALRALLLHESTTGPDLGARVVVEQSTGTDVDVAEASLFVLGGRGRLEFGERQGLPDVLLGYAPNNFTFTGAEFGPASGPSLDPGGGLSMLFLDADLAESLRGMAALGFAATLADDRSAKLVYVSPKRAGWLGGLSYAADATDAGYDELLQFGLTHDRYWGENVLHVGGSYSHARAADGDVARRDLDSVNVGATLTLGYDWMLGASVGYDGRSGLPRSATGAHADDAWGAVASVNWNRGPWTAGAFAQWSRAEGESARRGDDRYVAFEAGASYRIATRLRLFAAWYAFNFEADGGTLATDRHRGDLVILGVRATL